MSLNNPWTHLHTAALYLHSWMVHPTPTVSVFFMSGLAPAPHPSLTSHTIICYLLPTITTQEEVVPPPDQANWWTPCPGTPSPELPKVCFISVISSHHGSVMPSLCNGSASFHKGSATESDFDLTSMSSDNEAEEESISKPFGEAGRPQSGSYNLKKAIHLKHFNDFQVGVYFASVDQH